MIKRKIRFALIGAASAVIVCAASFAAPISTEEVADPVPVTENQTDDENLDTVSAAANTDGSTVNDAVDADLDSKTSTIMEVTPEKTPITWKSAPTAPAKPDPSPAELSESTVEIPDSEAPADDAQSEIPNEQEPTVDEEPDEQPEEPSKPTGTKENPSHDDIDILIQMMDTDVLDQLFEDGAVYTPSQLLSAYVSLRPDFQGIIDTYYG